MHARRSTQNSAPSGRKTTGGAVDDTYGAHTAQTSGDVHRACRVFACGGGGGRSIEPPKTEGVREKGSIDKHH